MRPAFKLRKAVIATLACFSILPFVPGNAQSQTLVTGAIGTYPGVFSIGPGFTDIGNNTLTVANGADGSLSMSGGSILRVGALGIGSGGTGMVELSGSGTRLDLIGDASIPGLGNSLMVGVLSVGTLTLANGATLDGRANQAGCIGQGYYCNVNIGNTAGSNGTFIVTGLNTSASFLHGFTVANAFVAYGVPGYGTPGATAQGSVQVLDGGLLRTQVVNLGTQWSGLGYTGTERSFADVVIRGAGSTWLVESRSLESQPASFNTATGANTWATVTISEGGKLRMEGMAGQYNNIDLTTSPGRTDFTVTGANSRLEMAGSNALLQIGRSLGTANMSVLAGGVVDGPYIVNVGRDGARGSLTIDGAGSRFNMYGTGAAGTGDANAAADMFIGRNGTGTVTVSNGGRLDISAAGPTSRSPFVILGFQNAGSTGTLNITGTNSVVSLTAASSLPGGGAAEAFNPFVGVGYDGSGTLNISAGGKLLMDGTAFSTASASRGTQLTIGGRNDTTAGGTGIARVSGAGSEIALSGTDRAVNVGWGPNANGLLTMTDNAALASTLLSAGRSTGTGVIKLDNAQINLSGQLTGSGQPGAGLTIGDGTGSIGIVSLQNNARLNIANPGSSPTGVAIGGSPFRTGGTGVLNLSSGSVLQITAPAATSGISVGRSGSGQMNVSASTVDVGGGSIYVGRDAGSVGTMTVSANSTVTAGYVGVGRTQSGNGGTGTLIVNSSTLTATNIEIGSSGYLGGNGTIVGNIVNYGTVNPGNSPGTLIIDGSFVNGLGGKLVMEVESNGTGGFNTDHLIFKNGSNVNLNGLEVNFHFLGNTDPNAFKASGGFVINQFLQGQDAQGQLVDLAPETFAGASFTAQADQYNFSSFSFSATAGAAFTAAPVPEPGEWMLMLAGLGLIGAISSRRSRSRKVEAG